MSSGQMTQPPSPATRPMLTWVSPMRAVSAMKVVSQRRATEAPNPAAGPLMAAMSGASQLTMFCTAHFAPRRMSIPPLGPKSFMSPPAQKAGPAPVRTMAPTSGSVPRSRQMVSSPRWRA